MCPRTAICVSSYCYMCPHAAIYVSSCCCMCPHTATYVSSCCYMCPHAAIRVLTLLHTCPHAAIRVRTLLHTRPHAAIHRLYTAARSPGASTVSPANTQQLRAHASAPLVAWVSGLLSVRLFAPPAPPARPRCPPRCWRARRRPARFYHAVY